MTIVNSSTFFLHLIQNLALIAARPMVVNIDYVVHVYSDPTKPTSCLWASPTTELLGCTYTLGMAANVPLGVWREHTNKFSPQWFAAVRAAVSFIATLRKSVLMPKTVMAITIS